MKRKYLLSLATLLSGLVFATVVESGNPAAIAATKMSKSVVLAALTNPLGLFAARSPGARGAGALLPTKPERTAALAPEERVLSQVRDREPPFGAMPGAGGLPDDAVMGFAPEAPGAGGGFPDDYGSPVGQTIGGPPSSVPGYDDEGVPEYVGNVAPFVPPPGGVGVISAVPEPGTWAVMFCGFLAVGAALRRRRQARVTCP